MGNFLDVERRTNCTGLASRLRHKLKIAKRGKRECEERAQRLTGVIKDLEKELAGVEFELSRLGGER